MANWYINPGLGSGTNAGTSWANAFNSTTTAWTDAITASSAGDDFYVNAASTCSNSTTQTLTFKGTAASPNRIFSCSTITNNPPVSADLGAGAAFTTTGASGITINGTAYVYGCTFNMGTGTSAATFSLLGSAGELIFDTSNLKLLIGTATCPLSVGVAGSATRLSLINTPITFNGGTSSSIQLNSGWLIWKNTASAVLGTQSALTNLITPNSNRTCMVLADGVDFAGGTGIGSGKNIIAASAASIVAQFANCKYTSGAVVGARPTVTGAFIDQIVTDSGATSYKQQRDTYQGTLTASTTVYNNASDGVTPISWQVVTTANANPQSPFECFAIPQWVAAGTYANSKIFITSATAALKTNDVWVDVEYLGTNYALGSTATSFGAGSGSATLPQIPAGTTPGTLAASSPAWAVGGLGNDYQLAIPSFTTSAAGYVRFMVKVGKATLTVNIDPKAVIAA